MGLTKSGKKQKGDQGKGGGKTSNFKRDTSTSGASGGNNKDKRKGLANFYKAMEQSGLVTINKKGRVKGPTKDTAIPGIANMFLKIPGIKPSDLKGVDPKELQRWIRNSPEGQDLGLGRGGGGGGGGGNSGGGIQPPRPVTPIERPVKGPGWISVTRLLGKRRA